jgi:hypothetical protein
MLLYTNHIILTISHSWRHLKKEWLHLWPKMRLDLLVWTVIEKIVPEYVEEVEQFLRPTKLARDASSWRKEFKREWRKCEVKDTSTPGEFPYTKYNPDPGSWTCACPAYRDSRFLICKHLIQRCHPVTPRFFLEVTRNRTTPFWSHPSLVPLEEDDEAGGPLPPSNMILNAPVEEWESDSDQDFDDSPLADLTATYETQMESLASDLEDLASMVRHQIQFREVRLLARA